MLTSVRTVLGVFIVFLPIRGESDLAGTLWLMGLWTDSLDGACARKLGVAGNFGALFDCFADYLYYVIAPAILSFFLIGTDTRVLGIFLLSLPCLFGAIRYARKIGLNEREFPGIPASPGLATLVYGLFVVSLVFARREKIFDSRMLTLLLFTATPFLSLLMVVRTRYPKLGVYPWILVPILIGLVIMPFFQTAILVRVALGLVVIYVLLSPLLVSQHPKRSADITESDQSCS